MNSAAHIHQEKWFLSVTCPRSSAPQKPSPPLGFPLSPALITQCSEELAIQTGNNALRSCPKDVFPNYQDVFAGTEGAAAVSLTRGQCLLTDPGLLAACVQAGQGSQLNTQSSVLVAPTFPVEAPGLGTTLLETPLIIQVVAVERRSCLTILVVGGCGQCWSPFSPVWACRDSTLALNASTVGHINSFLISRFLSSPSPCSILKLHLSQGDL